MSQAGGEFVVELPSWIFVGSSYIAYYSVLSLYPLALVRLVRGVVGNVDPISLVHSTYSTPNLFSSRRDLLLECLVEEDKGRSMRFGSLLLRLGNPEADSWPSTPDEAKLRCFGTCSERR